MFYKKGVFRNSTKFTGKHRARVSFLIKLQAACNFIQKETLIKVFSCEFCEISKNTFSYRTLLVAPSTSALPKQLLCYLFLQENVQTNIKGKTLGSSRSQMFFSIAVLKNFAINVKKTPVVECLFCFLKKFLRTAFLQNTSPLFIILFQNFM